MYNETKCTFSNGSYKWLQCRKKAEPSHQVAMLIACHHLHHLHISCDFGGSVISPVASTVCVRRIHQRMVVLKICMMYCPAWKWQHITLKDLLFPRCGVDLHGYSLFLHKRRNPFFIRSYRWLTCNNSHKVFDHIAPIVLQGCETLTRD